MTFYYVDPHPERFVEEVRQLAARGALTHPDRSLAALTFLSRLIAANPSKIRGWLDALSDLPPNDLRSLETAIWLADTPEAKACLAERTDHGLLAKAPPDILATTIDGPNVLDALWACYFATGNLQAVRRIISVLEYMSDYGAAQAFRDSPQTDADKSRALRDAMFQAASWSIGSLIREHPPLKAFCGDLVRSGDLTPNERCALAIVLAKDDPRSWRVTIDPETNKASVAWVNQVPADQKRKPWWRLW